MTPSGSHARGRRTKPAVGSDCLRALARNLAQWIPKRSIALTLALLSPVVQAASERTWNEGLGFRFAPLPAQVGNVAGFTALPAQTLGISFTNTLHDARSVQNRNLLSGSGVAAGDFDGDGLCDLFFCGLDSKNQLYRNLGSWRFDDVTAQAGLDLPNHDSTGAAFADVNGDGRTDLLVNSLGGGTRLFLNQGQGRFQETTAQAGLSSTRGSMSMALADVDGDGDLDLYVANFRPTTIKDEQTTKYQVRTVEGRPVIALVNGKPTSLPEYTNRFEYTPSGNVLEFGEPDALYINDGQGRFTAASWTDGTFLDEDGKPLREAPRDWGLAVQFHDLNGDGSPDIYVCNDLFTPDRIWLNDGKGRFRALPRLALRNTSTFSMGVDFGDLNRDGHVDFFVVDMLSRDPVRRKTQMAEASATFWPIGLFDNRPQILRNTLHIGRGDGSFAEMAQFAGVEASEWSWGPIFLDVDLDGYEDILVTNGQLRDFQNGDIAMEIEKAKATRKLSNLDLLNLFKLFPGLHTPNVLFRNRGDLTFEEVGERWGFATPGISQGMALADLDNDGDLDVVMNNLQDAPGLYRNNATAPRVAVRLKGKAPNTHGIGASIRVVGGVFDQTQEMIAGGRYLSGDDPIRTFAARDPKRRFDVEVTWRNGTRTIARGVAANTVCEVNEQNSASLDPLPYTPQQPPEHTPKLFTDVSQLLNHQHHEEAFDDFALQPLLPRRLSQLGPGVCWHDFDGDGWDDLAIGSGRGGPLALYRNDGKGGLSRWEGAPLARNAGRDQTTLLGFGPILFTGLANYEDGSTNGGHIAIYDFNRKASGESVLHPTFSTGPMSMADVDADGDLDLFIGGRVTAGRYPASTASLLMRNDGGRFSVLQRFDSMGLASGSVFTDLDDDGRVELVVACEWGPIRVFKRNPASGVFEEVTSKLGLDALTGWWNGVAAGDFDSDGRMDLVASNWGLNTHYRADPVHPRRIYFGDLAGSGQTDVIEAYVDTATGNELPDREFQALVMSLPSLRERFLTLASFGKAHIAEILGDQAKLANRVQATTLEPMVLLNRGGRFEPRPLPPEAQRSPAFGIAVADFDGDRNEDIYLGQNHFATHPQTSRADAGRGLLLRGDGHGGFAPMPATQSGLEIYGEQRGAAAADYDGDGRVDLVTTQNGASTRLFHNTGGTPGLRVRFAGPPSNATSIGTQARAIRAQTLGPAREIHAGAGYWSQDSATLIFAHPSEINALLVRWPSGLVTTNSIPPSSAEVRILENGTVERLR